MRSFSYSNFTVGIRNTTVFDIPAECKHASFLNVVSLSYKEEFDFFSVRSISIAPNEHLNLFKLL